MTHAWCGRARRPWDRQRSEAAPTRPVVVPREGGRRGTSDTRSAPSAGTEHFAISRGSRTFVCRSAGGPGRGLRRKGHMTWRSQPRRHVCVSGAQPAPMRIVDVAPLIATVVWIAMLAAFGWLAAVFPRSRAVRRLAARARSALTGIRRNAARMRAEARRAWHRASKATFAMEPRALVAAGTLLTALMTIVGFRRFGDQGFAGNLAAEAVGTIAAGDDRRSRHPVRPDARGRAALGERGDLPAPSDQLPARGHLPRVCTPILDRLQMDPVGATGRRARSCSARDQRPLQRHEHDDLRRGRGQALQRDVFAAVFEIERVSAMLPAEPRWTRRFLSPSEPLCIKR